MKYFDALIGLISNLIVAGLAFSLGLGALTCAINDSSQLGMWILLLATIVSFCVYCLRGLDLSQSSIRRFGKTLELVVLMGIFLPQICYWALRLCWFAGNRHVVTPLPPEQGIFETMSCLVSIVLWVNLMNWRKTLFARSLWRTGLAIGVLVFCAGFNCEDGFDKEHQIHKFERLRSELVGKPPKQIVMLVGLPKHGNQILKENAVETWFYDTGYGVVFQNNVCIEIIKIHTFH